MTAGAEAEWARLARFGPFFAVEPLGTDAPWRPIAQLGEPEVLRRRAAAVATALGAGRPADQVESEQVGPDQVVPDQVGPERVAASVSQLGLSARLSAVALAASAAGLAVPSPAGWRYVDRLGGPFPVGLTSDRVDCSVPPWPHLLLALIRPLAVATIATFSLSPQVVWGNVASGLTGAARMIISADPGLADTVAALLDAAFATDELRSTMITDSSGQPRRRSCCLIYRLSGSTAAICGDCVLARPTR